MWRIISSFLLRIVHKVRFCTKRLKWWTHWDNLISYYSCELPLCLTNSWHVLWRYCRQAMENIQQVQLYEQIILYPCFILREYHGLLLIINMMHQARKGPSCHMREITDQMSLRILVVWSGHSLSAYKKYGHHRIHRRTEKAQIGLRTPTVWFGLLFAYDIRVLYIWFTSYHL